MSRDRCLVDDDDALVPQAQHLEPSQPVFDTRALRDIEELAGRLRYADVLTDDERQIVGHLLSRYASGHWVVAQLTEARDLLDPDPAAELLTLFHECPENVAALLAQRALTQALDAVA